VDLASMNFGLEVREPLLNYLSLKFACQLPYELKNDGITLKKIFKDITNKYVPKNLLDRPKNIS